MESKLFPRKLYRVARASRITFTNEWDITIDEESNMIKEILVRGLYAKQLQPWLAHFKLNDDILVIQDEKFLDNQADIEYVGIPPFNLDSSVLSRDYSPNKKRKKKVQPVEMVKDTRVASHRLFRPYNQELADLLGEEWRNVWVEDMIWSKFSSR